MSLRNAIKSEKKVNIYKKKEETQEISQNEFLERLKLERNKIILEPKVETIIQPIIQPIHQIIQPVIQPVIESVTIKKPILLPTKRKINTSVITYNQIEYKCDTLDNIYNIKLNEFHKNNLLWNDLMDNDIFRTFLHEQGENGGFDPIEAYYNTLTDQEKEIQRISSIEKNLGKKEQKKALKGKSDKVKNIIEKNNEKKNKLLLDNENEHIIRLENDIKSSKNITLNDIASKILSINLLENKLYIYQIFILKITDEYLLKIIFIEIVRLTNNIIDKKFHKLIKFMESFKKKYSSNDIINFQLSEMQDIMPPHSPFQKNIKKVDDWQKQVMELINQKSSIFIDAPTSSGKTICSTYCACVVNKVLFIVPTKELANQVAGTFRKMKTKSCDFIPIMLITSDNIYMDDNPRIFIGTPIDIERWLNLDMACNDLNNDLDQIDTCTFEYIIVDEIHQMNNKTQGPSMQRLIKRFDCPMLGISATIGNPDEMTEWMRYLKKDSKYSNVTRVSYNKRFINQEKYYWDGKEIIEIHPLSVLDINYIQNGELIKSVIAFTPKNCFELYNVMIKYYPLDELREIQPENFFENLCLSLELCKLYQDKLKFELSRLSNLFPNETQLLLNEFIIIDKKLASSEAHDYYTMLKILQKKNMFPALGFKFEPNECQCIVYSILEYMENEEQIKYPNYRFFKEIQNEYYKEMNIQINKIDDMKFDRNCDIQDEKDKRIKQLNQDYLDKYINDISTRLKHLINKYQDLLESEDNQLYQFYVKYYNNELTKLQSLQCLTLVNEYAPHPEFTFSDFVISEDTMRNVKHLLHNFYKQERGIKITYNHPFLKCIERGIILYLNILPIPFQRVAQMLIGKNLAPITFSDESLAFGINYPIRSVILIGSCNNDKLDDILAQQASGRSGRRGLDTKGNVIYFGIDWKPLYKARYLEITGENPDNNLMIMPKRFTRYFNDGIKNLCKISLQDFINIKTCDISIRENERFKEFNEKYNEIMDEYSGYNLIEIYRLGDYINQIKSVYNFLDFLKNKLYCGYKLDKYLLFEILATLLINDINYINETESLNETRINNLITEYNQQYIVTITNYNIASDLGKIYKMGTFSIFPDNISENISKINYVIEFIRILYNQRRDTKKVNIIIELSESIFIDLRNLILKYLI